MWFLEKINPTLRLLTRYVVIYNRISETKILHFTLLCSTGNYALLKRCQGKPIFCILSPVTNVTECEYFLSYISIGKYYKTVGTELSKSKSPCYGRL